MIELILSAAVLIGIGLMALGYFVAGRWWQGWARWAMGCVFGCVFVLAMIAILVAGCTFLVFTQ